MRPQQALNFFEELALMLMVIQSLTYSHEHLQSLLALFFFVSFFVANSNNN